jgi:multicomponent Na+:H+ antiporter subunit G
MIEWLVSALLLLGAVLMLIAAIGLVRMPDLPTRMHATSKAGTLGAGMMLAGVAIHFAEAGVMARAIAAIAFIILTAPVAAHAIGRAGYAMGVPLWSRTVKDELKGHYAGRGGEADGTPPPVHRNPADSNHRSSRERLTPRSE